MTLNLIKVSLVFWRYLVLIFFSFKEKLIIIKNNVQSSFLYQSNLPFSVEQVNTAQQSSISTARSFKFTY